MIYLQLLLSFLQIGALSFGGGYAAMPLIQAQIVTEHQWLSMSEFTDLVTIAEMTPGPIAVNSATLSLIHISLKKSGAKVMIITVFEAILASVLVFIITFFVLGLELNFSIVLAALASATAPASTVMTIRQTCLLYTSGL